MYNFVYNIPTKIYFGDNQISNLGKELKKFGNKVLLCYGGGSIKKIGLYDEVVAEIKKAGLELFELNGIEPNPRVTSVKAGAEICKREKIDVLLAVGGGSVIDCTKAIGAATFYDGDPWDLVIGKAKFEKALPLVSILTLSATGSEMDIFGVISNMDSNDKVGFASKEVLQELIYKYPFTQIGKMFGVTDNTIRKWCKKYGLPFRRRDIDNNEQAS